MPRLIDDLRAPGARLEMPRFVRRDYAGAWEQLATKCHEMIMCPDLPVLRIDNVAEYFFTASDQEHWSLDRDFPNLAPPYPAFWCEHKMARTIHSKECGDTDVAALCPKGRVGTLISAIERDNAKGQDIPEATRWILWCELYVDYNHRGVAAQGPHGSVFLCVDAEGRAIDAPWMHSFAPDELTDMMKSYMTWFNPIFLAISFLHCKNVTLIENHEPAALAKKYKARTGIAPTGYKTLVIEPLKAILRKEGRSNEVGVAKAMHICRGHFRDYREGRGLFGRYHQLVWTPSVIRGTKGKSAPPREVEIKV